MLEIIVRLKKRITSEELDQYAADTPDVTRIAPAQIEYNFWCSIVSCGHDGRVVFIVKRG